jgi:hypothetical protein
MNGDEDFAETWFGLWGVGVAENFGAAVMIEEDGFHANLREYAKNIAEQKRTGLKTGHYNGEKAGLR